MSVGIALFQQTNQVQNARWGFGHDYERLLGLDRIDTGVNIALVVESFSTECLEFASSCELSLTLMCDISYLLLKCSFSSRSLVTEAL
jgi:hypothetical protein